MRSHGQNHFTSLSVINCLLSVCPYYLAVDSGQAATGAPHTGSFDDSASPADNRGMLIPQTQNHMQAPVYIPEDITIPEEFDLRESQTYEGISTVPLPLILRLFSPLHDVACLFSGLGIWTKKPVAKGTRYGPFTGVLKKTCDDASSAWEVSSYPSTSNNYGSIDPLSALPLLFIMKMQRNKF